MKRKYFDTLRNLTLLNILMGLIMSCQNSGKADEKLPPPNILVLTIEDISPYAFSMYGNELVEMPALDRLADEGITFDNASSNAPYCSPARSTIISGSYATTYGTDVHRAGRQVPEDQYFFPRLLREAGYFTTNNSKTDYNVADQQWEKVEKEVWNENSDKATYNSSARKKGQPFFAVFNNLITHWSRLNSIDTSWRQPLHIPPGEVNVPAFVPDIPEIRNGLAWHYQKAEQASEWVDVFLKDLQEKGLLENTIIFFFSDHGGILPRSKGFGYHIGTRVPFLVRIPEQYQHLFELERGNRSSRLIEFTDIGPTILSLAGIEPPEYMQGKAFAGEYAQPPDSLQFTFRTNNAHHYAPSRSAFDGRYKYIRFFVPYKPDGLRQDYQYKLPELLAYDSLNLEGLLQPLHETFFQAKAHKALFDLQQDPDEVNNLVDDPARREILRKLRKSTFDHMIATQDLGLFPMSMRKPEAGISLYEWVRENNYPLNQLIEIAWMASEEENFEKVFPYLTHARPEFRFWAAVAANNAAKKGWLKTTPVGLADLHKDKNPEVRAVAAEALYNLGQHELALQQFRQEVLAANLYAYSVLEETDAAIARLLPEVRKMTEHQDFKVRFYARSLLIEAGELPHGSLLEARDYQEVKETFAEMQNHLNWLP